MRNDSIGPESDLPPSSHDAGSGIVPVPVFLRHTAEPWHCCLVAGEMNALRFDDSGTQQQGGNDVPGKAGAASVDHFVSRGILPASRRRK